MKTVNKWLCSLLVLGMLCNLLTACQKKTNVSSMTESKTSASIGSDSSDEGAESDVNESNTTSDGTSKPNGSTSNKPSNTSTKDDGPKVVGGDTKPGKKEVIFYGDFLPNEKSEEYEDQVDWLITVGKKFDCNIKVMKYDDWTTSMENFQMAAMAGENLADMIAYGAVAHPTWMVNGLLEPMEKYIDVKSSLYDQSVRDEFYYKKHYYGVVEKTTPLPNMVIFYNKEIFDDAGIFSKYNLYDLVKKNKWTWDVFEQVAKDCVQYNGKTGEVETYGVGGIGPTGLALVDSLMISNNCYYLKKQGDRLTYAMADAPNQAAMNFAHKLVWTDKVSGTTGYWASWDSMKLFTSGLVGMYITQIIYGADFKTSMEEYGGVGLLPLPIGPNANGQYYSQALSPTIYSMPTTATNKEFVADVFEYWLKNNPKGKDIREQALEYVSDENSLDVVEMLSKRCVYNLHTGYESLRALSWSTHGVLEQIPPSTLVEQYRASIESELKKVWGY